MEINTPVKDFIEKYAKSGISRFHMPAHKGNNGTISARDITEIKGADFLYSAEGIIGESERNASRLFGTAETFYSTEGSSLCIKTMVYLAVSHKSKGQKNLLLAPRNIHRSFADACILCDVDIGWIEPAVDNSSICSAKVGRNDVEQALKKFPDACGVYITSPDYLGNIADISGIAQICHKYTIPLIVDNAHGAYLAFMRQNFHPISLGADMCCDSAHKTLPVLTGGAYIHFADKNRFAPFAKPAMAMFGSSSPSYLILESLDECNRFLAESAKEDIADISQRISETKTELKKHIEILETDEPLKIVLAPNSIGFMGGQFADFLRERKIECEYADYFHVVLMVSPFNTQADLNRLEQAVAEIKPKSPIKPEMLAPKIPSELLCGIRKAAFSPSEIIPTEQSIGRISAENTLVCCPCIPVAVCGEVITEENAEILKKNGIDKVKVVAD